MVICTHIINLRIVLFHNLVTCVLLSTVSANYYSTGEYNLTG